jgi:nicotinate-nucleotide adenylyltransferase
MKNDDIIKEDFKRKQNKRFTAVFGGTFDPIHKAHLALADKVLEMDLADEIMFVPAAKPPHKLDKPITPSEHRTAMLKLALETNPDYSMSDYEIVNKRKASYTVHTLRALQAAFPERRFKLIMGMDNFRDFDSWHRYQEIINNFDLIIFSRPENLKPSLHLIEQKFGNRIAGKLAQSFVDSVNIDMSATDIRTKVNREEDISDLVLPSIADYIIENGLYTS